MLKILLLGFSVTDYANAYSYEVKRMLGKEGHQVHICGLGGTHPQYLAFFLDKILSGKAYDLVVLEVFTSAYRAPNRSADEYHWPLWHMVETCRRNGAAPMFLSLPRRDVNYSSDAFTDAGRSIGKLLDVPFIDVAPTLDWSAADTAFKDVVHPTESGSMHYFNQLMPILREQMQAATRASKEFAFEADSLFAIEFAAYSEDSSTFERSGFVAPFVTLTPRDTFEVQLAEPLAVNAVSYVMGPRSSYLSLDWGGGPARRIETYDEFCFYERFHAQTIAPVVTKSVKVRIGGELPEIALRKGEKDTSERAGKICHLLCSSRPLNDIVRDMSSLWS